MHPPTVNLVVIRSTDLARAARFYEAIGVTFVRHSHGSSPEHLAYESAGVVFEIYPRAGERDDTRAARLGFRVASVDAAIERLEMLGATIVSPAKASPWGRRAVVDDFDGHRVELIEQ